MSLHKKRILCITGTRADFGKMKPLLACIENHPRFELHLLITGMHMLKTYGNTHREVCREGYRNCYLLPNQMKGENMAAVLANTIHLLNRLCDEIEPDMLLIHGDRVEALGGATVGALGNRLVCHIEGGELSGTIDDAIRHAVSKLAHLHLVANESARRRLIQMGENADGIHIIGSPDLDLMLSADLPPLAEVKRHYDIPFDDYGISLFHPVTTELDRMAEYAGEYFRALEASGRNIIAIYPNNDAGTEHILNRLQNLTSPRFKIYPSIRFEAFLVLLKHARFMIGNSSAGIREAPFYGIPSIDVGTRQQQRHRSPSIIRTTYAAEDILQAVRQIGDGQRHPPDDAFKLSGTSSAERFAQLLEREDTWRTAIQKRFIDLR